MPWYKTPGRMDALKQKNREDAEETTKEEDTDG